LNIKYRLERTHQTGGFLQNMKRLAGREAFLLVYSQQFLHPTNQQQDNGVDNVLLTTCAQQNNIKRSHKQCPKMHYKEPNWPSATCNGGSRGGPPSSLIPLPMKK